MPLLNPIPGPNKEHPPAIRHTSKDITNSASHRTALDCEASVFFMAR